MNIASNTAQSVYSFLSPSYSFTSPMSAYPFVSLHVYPLIIYPFLSLT